MSLVEEATFSRAFGPDAEDVEKAREEILAYKSMGAIEHCVELSRAKSDIINVEFWLRELAKTWIDVNVSAAALTQLFDEVWEPKGRFHEALLYLTRIEGMLVGRQKEDIATRVSRSQRALSEKSAFVIGDGWKSWSAEDGFDSPQKSFDSLVTFWVSLSDEKVARAVDGLSRNFVQYCSVYLGAFLKTSEKVSSEIAHAAYGHFLSIRLADLKLDPPISDALVDGIGSSLDSTV